MNANFIVFCGEIMSIYRTEKNGHLLLRVSDGHEYVGFFIADEKIKEEFCYSVGERICLCGNIQSHSSSADGKRHPPTIFVTSISKSDYTDGFNKFYVSGKIVRVTFRGDACTVVLQTKEKHISFVPITFFFMNEEVRSLAPGMIIATAGKVQICRRKKAVGEGYKYRQIYTGYSNTLKKIA